MEKVILQTSDNVTIVGDYYPSKEEKGFTPSLSRGVLLLHMMPVNRDSWHEFAPRLMDKGYHVLAIDLRGHGESGGPALEPAKAGPDGYKDFSDEEHQGSIHDVEAGAKFLEEKGVAPGGLILIGASIGANLALWYLAEYSQVGGAILLSPGLNYRGIITDSLVRKLRAGQRVLFVASEDDERSGGNNAVVNQALHGFVPEGVEKKLIIYKKAGHGTDMFGKGEPDLGGEILSWIGKARM